ncbi:Alginate lyase [Devosia sp. YR412]|uniref:alginate lyase family protein n=1 Tax=Devosia sp. YR412 TaxID=1881030 RepID=UPI0008C21ED7|nr:alginate lyase family protein [Devosia sp. YR412]SEQ02817.1 Alginate lyase [Devosia sp. YR412]
MNKLAIGFFAVASLCTFSSAVADEVTTCVQQFLSDAHYEIGVVDGQAGRRTFAAAKLLQSRYKMLDLPELSSETMNQWCEKLSSDAGQMILTQRSILGTVAMSEQEGPADFWSADNRTDVCFGASFQRGASFRVPLMDTTPAFTESIAAGIKPIFPPAPGAPECDMTGGGNPPKPLIDAGITGDYHGGSDWVPFEPSYLFLSRTLAAYRYAATPELTQSLVTFLTEWASANALSQNIYFPGSSRLDFHVLSVLPGAIIAFSEVADAMSMEEKMVVGKWLTRLVDVTGKSPFMDRQDNKAYLVAYIVMLWGVLIDEPSMIDAGIEAYKNAIYDMRPDGSFPVDSGRGGSGLHYSNRSTMMMVALATLGDVVDADLHEFTSSGRSLKDAVEWMVASSKFPELNQRHALSCPDGGDGNGSSIASPELAHVLNGSMRVWVTPYLMSGKVDDDLSATLQSGPYGNAARGMSEVRVGGPLACFAAGIYGQD